MSSRATLASRWRPRRRSQWPVADGRLSVGVACHILRLTLRTLAPTVFHSKLSLRGISTVFDARVFNHPCHTVPWTCLSVIPQ